MFDGSFRAPVERAVKPLGNALRRTGMTPDHLTVAGIVNSTPFQMRRSASAGTPAN